MIDENTTAILAHLKELQKTANTCAYLLIFVGIGVWIIASKVAF